MRDTIKFLLLIASVLLFFSQASFAREKNTEHTLKLGAGKQAKASIEDARWLSGSWTGTAFNSQFEEVWNAPSAGSMMGMFKLFSEGEGISFYELMIIVEKDNSLELKVKHFDATFNGWEKKDDFLSFPLVALEKDALHFSGLSFLRQGKDKITAYIAISQKDGSVKEEQLLYARQQ